MLDFSEQSVQRVQGVGETRSFLRRTAEGALVAVVVGAVSLAAVFGVNKVEHVIESLQANTDEVPQACAAIGATEEVDPNLVGTELLERSLIKCPIGGRLFISNIYDK